MSTQTLQTPVPQTEPGNPVPVSQGSILRNTLTMAWRGLLKIKHNPEQLFDVVIQPLIFTAMFVYIFGGAIAGNVHAYLPIIIPGILVQTVITTSVVTGVQLREDLDKGVFDRFKSLPMAHITPLSGALLADTVRYGIATVITVAVGLAMGYRPHGGVLGVIAAAVLLLLCAFALSWIFALMGVLMRKASSVQGVSLLVLFPLTFVSNAFVRPETMPGWLQGFVKINPVSNLVTALRELMNDGHLGLHVVWALLGAAAVTAVFAPLTVRLYRRRL